MQLCSGALDYFRRSPEADREDLKSENQALKAELASLKKRLEKIESTTSAKADVQRREAANT